MNQPPVAWGRLALIVAAGLALVVFTAVLYDARIIAWTHTLPGFVHLFFARATRLGQSDWLLLPTGTIVILVALVGWTTVARLVSSGCAWP